jgi:hypothetical protein
MRDFPDRHGSGSESAGLKSRGDALRQAAALPGAELSPLLEAALAELDGAVSVLAAAERSTAPAHEPPPEAVHAERRLLHAVFQQQPIPSFVLGRDGIVRRANAAADGLLGAGLGYATGKAFTALIDPLSRAAVSSQLAAVARTGRGQQFACNVLAAAGAVKCELAVRLIQVRGDDDRLLVAVGPPAGASPFPQAMGGVQPDAAAAAVLQTMTRRLDTATAVARLLLENIMASEAVILQRCARLLAGELAALVIVDMDRAGRLRRHFVAGPPDQEAGTPDQEAGAAAAADPPAESLP